jgi:hypothetical protein
VEVWVTAQGDFELDDDGANSFVVTQLQSVRVVSDGPSATGYLWMDGDPDPFVYDITGPIDEERSVPGQWRRKPVRTRLVLV